MDSTDFERGTSRILVAVRIRPEKKVIVPEGHSKGHAYGVFPSMAQKSIVRKLDMQSILLTDPLTTSLPPLSTSLEAKFRQNHSRDKIFSFDRVFTSEDTQKDVFRGAALEKLIEDVMGGINGTVFAYGPTGAGKTYTMMGTDADPGMTILLLTALFDKIASSSDEQIELQCIYLEIYNETIRDLLSASTPEVDLRTDHYNVPSTPGATRITLSNLAQSINLLKLGNTRRSTEPTLANAVSSRSHAIFSVVVKCGNTQAKLSMVDLAGSERAAGTGNRGARMIEGAAINRSLLALGNCINKLAGVEDDGAKVRKGKKERGYVNYRDSKLTRILSDSLGGNCRTIMIAACSPGSTSFEETCNTLKYAARARSITNATAPVPRIWDADGTHRLFDEEVEITLPPVIEKTYKPTSTEDLMALFDRIVKTQNTMLQAAGVKEDPQMREMLNQADKLKSLMEFKKKTHRRLKSKALPSSKSSNSVTLLDRKEPESAFDILPRTKVSDRPYHYSTNTDYGSRQNQKEIDKEAQPLPLKTRIRSKANLSDASQDLKPPLLKLDNDRRTIEPISVPTFAAKATPLHPITIHRQISVIALSSPTEVPSPLFGPTSNQAMLSLVNLTDEPPKNPPIEKNNLTKPNGHGAISTTSKPSPRQRTHSEQTSEGVFRRIAKVFQPKLTRNSSHPAPIERKTLALASVAPRLYDPKADEAIRLEQMKKVYSSVPPKPSKPKTIQIK